MIDKSDIGALLGCLLYLACILIPLALWIAVIYVAYHFAVKYW